MPRRVPAPGGGPPIALSELAIRNNYGVLEYSRTCQAAISGCTAGILGLTALYGFIFYFITALIQSIIWWLKAEREPSKYFMGKWTLLNHSMFGGLFTYVLFWTFLYGMVHVY